MISLIEPLQPESNEAVQTRSRYFRALRCLGVSEHLHGRHETAIASFQKAHDGYAILVATEPNRPPFRLKLGDVHEQLAWCYMTTGRLDDCERHARGMVEELTRGMELGGPSFNVQRFPIARGWFLIADVETRRNHPEKVLAALREVSTLLQPIKEQFGLQDICDQLSYLTEVVAGAAGETSTAGETDVATMRRVLEA